MLSTLDEAYVEFDPKEPLRVGERYSVYTPTRAVKHPISGKELGYLVQIFGEVQVKSVTDGNIARVLVVECSDAMERRYRVGPLKRLFRIDPRPAARDLVGVVVTTLQPQDLIGAENLVFIDRGRSDGVELGNRFYVVRRGDGYQPVLSKGPVDDRRFPREVVAEIIMVDVRAQIAAGVMVRSAKETHVGDRVESHRGE
jgi:hypothetical protein